MHWKRRGGAATAVVVVGARVLIHFIPFVRTRTPIPRRTWRIAPTAAAPMAVGRGRALGRGRRFRRDGATSFIRFIHEPAAHLIDAWYSLHHTVLLSLELRSQLAHLRAALLLVALERFHHRDSLALEEGVRPIDLGRERELSLLLDLKLALQLRHPPFALAQDVGAAHRNLIIATSRLHRPGQGPTAMTLMEV